MGSIRGVREGSPGVVYLCVKKLVEYPGIKSESLGGTTGRNWVSLHLLKPNVMILESGLMVAGT